MADKDQLDSPRHFSGDAFVCRSFMSRRSRLNLLPALVLVLLLLPLLSACTLADAMRSPLSNAQADGPLIAAQAGSPLSIATTGPRENPEMRVLLLHSYEAGLAWTSSVSSAVRDVLDGAEEKPVITETFLDWKQTQDEAVLSSMTESLIFRFSQDPPDLIFCSDDKALETALKIRAALGRDTPVVFCGVMQPASGHIIGGSANVTGVYETHDDIGTLSLIRTLQPALTKIIVVHDGTESGFATRDMLMDSLRQEKVPAEELDMKKTPPTLALQEISLLPDGCAVLLTSMNAVENGRSYAAEEFSGAVASISSVPVYSLYDYHMGSGIVGGSMMNIGEQARVAADMAFQILEGVSVSQLPIAEGADFSVRFDWNALTKWDLNPSLLPRQTIFINRPGEFYRQYRVLVLSVSLTIVTLLLMVIALGASMRARRKIERQLKTSNAALTFSHNDLLASEQRLKDQFAELQRTQEQTHQLAFTDSLTGLPNRTRLRELVTSSIRSRRGTPARVGLAVLDIDNFKLINNSFGHQIGDQLLTCISMRLSTLVASLPLCVLARTGGDEFVLLLPMDDRGRLEEPADRILDCFRDPFAVSTYALHVSASIGLVQWPNDGDTFDELLKNADTAMYHAKDSGRSRYIRFHSYMNDITYERTRLYQDMHDALANSEFKCNYQPKCTPDGRLDGYEALLRWTDSSGENIPPFKFIPSAESTGMIIPLGDFVFRESCRFSNRLRERHGDHLTVSVNVSIVQLNHPEFLNRLQRILEEEGTPASALVLEITESVLMASIDSNVDLLENMKTAGFRFSLDDFGTGYSSLTYLTMLPIEELKIDKTFVNRCSDPDHPVNAILRTIISLALELKLRIVAEGVETQEQCDFLASHSCDLIQGWLFSPALPEKTALEFAEKHA